MIKSCLAILTLIVAMSAGAAPVFADSPSAAAVPSAPLIQLAQARRICADVRRLCRSRWGGGAPYARCVRDRGCAVAPPRRSCQVVRQTCANAFRPGSPPFRQCMRRNGC